MTGTKSFTDAAVLLACIAIAALAQRTRSLSEPTQILGRPTDTSITLSVLSPDDGEVFVEYGTRPGIYSSKTKPTAISASKPLEISIEHLQPDTLYYYRLNRRQPGEECTFHTQRKPGSAFTFGVQGDSHPERRDRMYQPDLYRLTMQNVIKAHPDFYLTLGDDFSIEQLYNRDNFTPETVADVYINQRSFLGIAARSVPLFLVNGNHEEAARYLLNGKPDSVPVTVGRARLLYYPLPAPDRFYTGDAEPVEYLGLPRDYYAWTWGDATFITIDPYWHSPVQVDAGLGQKGPKRDDKGEVVKGEGKKKGDGRSRDGWGITMGDTQYQWFKRTLEQSKAKYKFVFAHHVNGTGRGGVEVADLNEWGGRSRNGDWEFDKKRPGWELPIHQLMVKHGVTIFFQGHDHVFARQEKDGVVYQETPNPADSTYSAFNREAYRSGDVLPNAGFLRVNVSPAAVKVDYIRGWLPKDETAEHKNGETAFSYTVTPRKAPTK